MEKAIARITLNTAEKMDVVMPMVVSKNTLLLLDKSDDAQRPISVTFSSSWGSMIFLSPKKATS